MCFAEKGSNCRICWHSQWLEPCATEQYFLPIHWEVFFADACRVWWSASLPSSTCPTHEKPLIPTKEHGFSNYHGIVLLPCCYRLALYKAWAVQEKVQYILLKNLFRPSALWWELSDCNVKPLLKTDLYQGHIQRLMHFLSSPVVSRLLFRIFLSAEKIGILCI